MEYRTLTSGSDTSGLAAASFSDNVYAEVYKSVLPSQAYTVDMRGHRTVRVPVYTPWSKSGASTSEAGTITPADPTFTSATITLSSKATSSTDCSAEFIQDAQNTSFLSAMQGIHVEALHRSLETGVITALASLPAAYKLTSGSPPSEADFQAAMAAVVPQSVSSRSAFYVHPLTWASMDSCDDPFAPGSIGTYRGFPVYPVYQLGTTSGVVGIFGDLKCGLGIGLGELDVRVLDQPKAASDTVVVQGILRYGVSVMNAGCIATINV